MKSACITLLKGTPTATLQPATWTWLQDSGVSIVLRGDVALAPHLTESQIWSGLSPAQTGVFDAYAPRNYATIPVAGPDLSGWVDRLGSDGVQVLAVDTLPALRSVLSVNDDRQCIIARLSVDALTASEQAVCSEALHAAYQEGWVVAVLVVGDFAPVERWVNVNAFFLERDALRVSGAGRAICWSETLAYQVGNGQVWINLRGREPSGIVAPGEEYDQARDAIVRLLKKWEDPVDERAIVEWVRKKEDLYKGSHLVHAPDLVVRLSAGYDFSERSSRIELDAASVQPALEGTQRWESSGRLLIAGRPVRAGVKANADFLDVAPTLMQIMEQPIPEDWQGRVLVEALQPEWLDAHPVQRAARHKLSADDEKALIERLQALGYLL